MRGAGAGRELYFELKMMPAAEIRRSNQWGRVEGFVVSRL
jgi:hypothetical protein